MVLYVLFSDKHYFQLIGEFSLRENVFYGAIFLSMILIILFCFIFVNKNNHITSIHHQAIYDMGKCYYQIGGGLNVDCRFCLYFCCRL